MIRSRIAAVAVGMLSIGLVGPAPAQTDDMRLVAAEPLAGNPVALPAFAEFHLVGGYETVVTDGRSVVAITVDRPGAAVVPVLTSYETILWELDATPGTEIVAVLADGSEQRPDILTALDVPVRQLDLPPFYRHDSANFGASLQRLREEFGMDRAAGVVSDYRLPASITISEVQRGSPHLDPDWPQPTQADPAVRVSLLTGDGTLQDWTLTGPPDGRFNAPVPPHTVVRSPDGAHIYEFANNAMVIRSIETDETRIVPMPSDMERVSWPQGIAYDTRRDEVALVTLGGEGFLYRFDAGTEQWIGARSMDNFDLYTLAYDPVEDLYVGIGEWWRSGPGMSIIAVLPGGTPSPRVLVQPELVGFARVAGVDPGDRRLDRNVWLIPTERGYLFFAWTDDRGGPGLWWLPRGATSAALTYRSDALAE